MMYIFHIQPRLNSETGEYEYQGFACCSASTVVKNIESLRVKTPGLYKVMIEGNTLTVRSKYNEEIKHEFELALEDQLTIDLKVHSPTHVVSIKPCSLESMQQICKDNICSQNAVNLLEKFVACK